MHAFDIHATIAYGLKWHHANILILFGYNYDWGTTITDMNNLFKLLEMQNICSKCYFAKKQAIVVLLTAPWTILPWPTALKKMFGHTEQNLSKLTSLSDQVCFYLFFYLTCLGCVNKWCYLHKIHQEWFLKSHWLRAGQFSLLNLNILRYYFWGKGYLSLTA